MPNFVQELKIVEESVEQTLLREEQALDSPDLSAELGDDPAAMKKLLKDLRGKHDVRISSLVQNLAFLMNGADRDGRPAKEGVRGRESEC